MLSKTKKREELLDAIVNVITHKDIYDTIDYRNSNESSIKQFMYQPLLSELTKQYSKRYNSEDKAKNKAKESLIWEANKQTTLHNITLFGTQHRPDMVTEINGLNIAIEVKKGSTGNDLRSGFGQCLVYQSHYDFIIYLFVDTSDDKRILNSVSGNKEKYLIDSIWENYNVRFAVV